ncbi:MAG: NADH-quinone oxidoreductase subunit C [Paracoccus sp. (in: a-proteobacteria)]|nr:NADH-quinone oxidoreductase subunit C [Paracoccus sp. (in: a-proteobacteria)]
MAIRPDTDALRELAELIQTRFPDDVHEALLVHDELTVNVALAGILRVIEFLQSDASCRFSTLIDITAVDHPDRPARFDLVYHFLSMYRNQRIRVKIALREDDLVPSATGLFPGANWYEREVFDLFGIMFSGHPDLRRILTDYGFSGHPLRKDFPTTGYVEVRYDESLRRVVYEPVRLTQEYRQFDFLSPWEGAKYVLPGDEKGEGAP